MILYTPLSSYDVFPVDNNVQAIHQVVSLGGKSLYVKQMDEQQLEIVQILSTDPKDFLNKNLQPGQRISFHELT